ncbi:MAG: threonine/serine exporter family protein [Kofleriaceae bacterium]|nr:threonine/serine exporter family protein [Kofleriaceae bacterium]
MDAQYKIAFILELGRALHRYGSPAHRLEGALESMASLLDVEIHVLSTPTSIILAFGPLTKQQSFLIRIEPGATNLGKLDRVDGIAESVAAEELSLEDAVAAIESIEEEPNALHAIWTSLAFPAVSAASALIMGGGYADMIVAGLSGVFVAVLALFLARRSAGGRLFEMSAAFVVGGIAHAGAVWFPGVSYNAAMLAGLITLVPGMTLTIAMTEIATRNLVSGTARLTSAAVVFLEILFGVAVSEQLLTHWIGMPPLVVLGSVPQWSVSLALLVSCLGAGALFRAHPRSFPLIVFTSIAAFYSARLGAHHLSGEIGACLGGFVAAAISNAYARLFNRSAMVNLIPSLLMLLPGSLGFRSLTSLWEQDVVGGIDTAFKMILVAISLVVGILVANAVILPRRSL